MSLYDSVWLCVTLYNMYGFFFTLFYSVWLRMSMYDSYDNVWFCTPHNGSLWFCITLYESVWCSMTLYDYVWFCFTLYDSAWLSMTLYWFETIATSSCKIIVLGIILRLIRSLSWSWFEKSKPDLLWLTVFY